MTHWSKFVAAKIALARKGLKPARPALANDVAGRIPPGQHRVKKLPVLDLGTRPKIKPDDWRLTLHGEIEQPMQLDWSDFLALPQVDICTDIHCVTRWSLLDSQWTGVRLADILEQVRPHANCRYVTLEASDNYTTNLPLAALLEPDVILAHRYAGRRLSREHGGPVRLVLPQLYFWKSAKWISGIHFHNDDKPGFWEERGYHNDANPWREERFRGQPTTPR